MTVTFTLSDADGTDVLAVRDRLPPGLPDHRQTRSAGRPSLAKIGALVEADLAFLRASVAPHEALFTPMMSIERSRESQRSRTARRSCPGSLQIGGRSPLIDDLEERPPRSPFQCLALGARDGRQSAPGASDVLAARVSATRSSS